MTFLLRSLIAAQIGILGACDGQSYLTDDQKRDRAVQAKRDARQLELANKRQSIMSSANDLLTQGKGAEALTLIAPYRQLKDSEVEELAKKAVTVANREREQEILRKIKSTKSSDRISLLLYYAELEKLDPTNKSYTQQWKRIRAEEDRFEEANRRRALAEDRARRRKEGVSIGMSQDEVLMSSWGRPERVNRTTTSRGTREQWVYGGSNYLYFENGRLTAIQN